MRSATAAVAIGEAAPYPLPPQLADICRATDWESFLPARAHTRSWRIQQRIKRVMDVVLAAVLLVVLSPVFLIVALIVGLTSDGPIFYQWRALGKNGRPFIGHKFRTMVVNADELKAALAALNEMTGPVFKVRKDPRITRPGAFLRKYSLDELPQLWSVIKGDMSLVGPRPPTADEFVQYEPRHRGKLSVIPGITCIWQVNGRNQIQNFEDWMELDRQYIQNWNLWLDVRLLFATLPAVLSAQGAS
jgi:lipopolysaccharide/colanic/teichoic acid biosynthesis glycosyltransferase